MTAEHGWLSSNILIGVSMEQLIIAVLDRIRAELDRCYWNKNQKDMNSPFENTGEFYSNSVFEVDAYNWNGNYLPNFNSKKLKCWWYKHSHRGLEYELNITTLKELDEFLNECLDAIRKDFE